MDGDLNDDLQRLAVALLGVLCGWLSMESMYIGTTGVLLAVHHWAFASTRRAPRSEVLEGWFVVGAAGFAALAVACDYASIHQRPVQAPESMAQAWTVVAFALIGLQAGRAVYTHYVLRQESEN